MLKRSLIVASIGALAIVVGAGGAAASTSESISSNWQVASVPASAPYVSTGTGTFSASGVFADAGALSLSLHFAAVPSPTVGVLHSDRTLTGQFGTITLRCNQIASDFSNPTAVPNTGNCTVIDGTGAYSGLHGHGTITGAGNLATLPFVLSDVLQLSIP